MTDEKYMALRRAELAARKRLERAKEKFGKALAAERAAYEARVEAGFALERQRERR